MRNSTADFENPRAPRPVRPSDLPTDAPWTRTEAGQRESIRIEGMKIGQTAVQSIGMDTRDPWGAPKRLPDYALAVSLLFTKATNQTIILGTPPKHVLSTSILWSSLAHDKRFEQVPMNEAAPGDIVIGSGWQQGADGYAGIVVDHGRIVSNSGQGVQDNSSLLEIQRSHPGMIAFRYVGFWNYYRSKPLANAGFNADEPRLPAGQPGGGQWTSGGAAKAAPAPTPRPQQQKAKPEQPSTDNNDDNDPKTVGQAAKETAQAFLSGLASNLRGILFPSEPDREPSKPKSLMQLAKEVDEAADNIDMTKPKGLGHAMAAGAAIAAGEAVSEGAAASASKAEPSGLDAISEAKARVQASRDTYGGADAQNMGKPRSSESKGDANDGSGGKGSANENTKNAASRGTSRHSDKPGNLPDQLRDKYPDTNLEFTKPGVKGQDVKVVGGKHPSEYPDSEWSPGADHGDFKPDTPGGAKTFNHDQKNKWTEPTQKVPYDPTTGKLK
jgi:hypothetical protein